MATILKEIPELVREEVITQDTADRIIDYYQRKEASAPNRLVLVFGILGSILTGLGIILIIAHNWDELSRLSKTVLSFIPLLTGQLLCAYALTKKRDSEPWKESAAAFLFFAVGASLSLISQIYHVSGTLGDFMLTWMVLCLPLVYILRSSVASVLYLLGITYYAALLSYWTYPSENVALYWLLFLLALPHYYYLYRNRPQSNFIAFHHWLVPLSLVVTLGTVAHQYEEWMFPAYMSLFGLFYAVGQLPFFQQQTARNNSYQALGSAGTVVLLLSLSFASYWHHLRDQVWTAGEVARSPELLATVVLSLAAGILLYRQVRTKALHEIGFTEWVFLLFLALFVVGMSSPVSVVLTNVLVFALGVATLREGARLDHLGVLNYGLFIIACLVICRFFDTDLSFVVRGLLFILVGLGFFSVNYWTLQKRKAHEQ